MSGDDKDKTVFGGKLPPVEPAPKQPPYPAPEGDKTMIGGALPPSGSGGAQGWGQPPQQPGWAAPQPSRDPWGQPAQPSQQPGWGQPGGGSPHGDTWLGGQLPPQAPQQPPAGYGQRPAQYPPQGGYPQNPSRIGQVGGGGEGFFPDIHRPQAPQRQMSAPRIPLEAALRGTGLGKGGSSNPLVAAAANLLILFGRLRTGLVEMQAMPLMDHVTREIDAYERNAISLGADPHEAQVAKYALCGTADDIVQNLPGADRAIWEQYSMVARFFGKRDSGVGFFTEAEKAMQAPGQRFNLLELMLICLSLGFEGQYRTLPNGSMELARIRSAIYETLRRVRSRPDEDVSPAWSAVPLGKKRRWGGVPLWIVASVAALLVVGTYVALSTLLNRDGAALAAELNAMHPNATQISLLRPEVSEPFVQPEDPSQLDRVRTALAQPIADGAMDVGAKGDYIFVRVNSISLFDSGKVEVKPEFVPLATAIATMLNAEDGPVIVQGFTDAQPLSGRGRYKNNIELSEARAESVRALLAQNISNPERITVEGRGEADPLAGNDTEEGRAQNRRVDILLAKEGTF